MINGERSAQLSQLKKLWSLSRLSELSIKRHHSNFHQYHHHINVHTGFPTSKYCFIATTNVYFPTTNSGLWQRFQMNLYWLHNIGEEEVKSPQESSRPPPL